MALKLIVRIVNDLELLDLDFNSLGSMIWFINLLLVKEQANNFLETLML